MRAADVAAVFAVQQQVYAGPAFYLSKALQG